MYKLATLDISNFGKREIRTAIDLLNASLFQGYPDNFEECNIQLAFNKNSGFVFFTNENFDVCMMNGDKLEMWIYLPYSGEEGFAEDFAERDKEDFHQDDIEHLKIFGVTFKEDEE